VLCFKRYSQFASQGKIYIAFKFPEPIEESECKFSVIPGAAAGVTFFGTGAGVKKVTPITSGLNNAFCPGG